MPRICVFCGGTPVTNEHLWPDWARRLLGDVEALPHIRQVRQDGRPPLDSTWRDVPYAMTVKAVCAACNNGWMSELERRAQEFLFPLLHGRGREIHRGGQRTLAAWALKTVLMFEQTQGAHRRAFPTEEHAHLLAHGEPSQRIRVWMATYAGTMPGSGRIYGLDADVTQGPDQGRRDMYGATITFGPVVVQVFGTEIAPLLDGLAINNPITHQIWPHQGSFTCNPRIGFDDQALAEFGDAILHHLLRAGGADPGAARPMLS